MQPQYPQYQQPQPPAATPPAATPAATPAAKASAEAGTEEKKSPTKPPKFIETKPLDPNVVGKDAADKYAEDQKKAKADSEKATKDYEDSQKAASDKKPPVDPPVEPAPGTPGETAKAALDLLYSVVQVPDQAAVEAAIDTAFAPPTEGGASATGGAAAGSATKTTVTQTTVTK
jgi:hypothetical protein